MDIRSFISALSSKSPVPGGGGASALIGAIGVSLCSMVANLTSGKKKYAQYQQDIDAILAKTDASIGKLLALMDEDAAVFEPLSKAYAIPKEEPGRDETVEQALSAASGVPMDILRAVSGVLDMLEDMAVKGTRLAVSDIGMAAAACRAAMQGAVMNVYANTKLMKNRERAEALNAEASALLRGGLPRCDAVYRQVTEDLGGAL